MLFLVYYSLLALNIFLFLCFFKRPSSALLFSGLIFSYGWRFISVGYIGNQIVPVNSEQMSRTILGIEPAISYFIINAIYLICILYIWKRLKEKFLSKEIEISANANKMLYFFDKIFFFSTLGVIVFSLTELIYKGIIPVRDCIERGAFNSFYQGFFHSFIIEHASMYSFIMGAMAFSPFVLKNGKSRQKYVFLASFFILYGFLTSNRFSFFLKLFLSFIAPIAFYLIQSRKDSYLKLIKEWSIVRAVGSYALVIICAMMLGLGNSYFRVRGNCEINNKNLTDKFKDISENHDKEIKLNNINHVERKVFDRFFVQQGEMWWPVNERVSAKSIVDIKESIKFLFVSPFVEGKNSGIQYVMMKTLGYERARVVVVEHGQTYAINQYDIFVEVLGWYIGTLCIVISGLVLVLLTYSLMDAYRKGNIFTVVSGVYVLYGIHLLTYAGMVNFFMTWTYWIKLLIFLFLLFFEKRIIELSIIEKFLNFLTAKNTAEK